MKPELRTWRVTEKPFSPARFFHSETIFTLGNGYLGSRATFEEGFPDEIASTLVHGIFNHHPQDLVPELANVPAWFTMQITIDGERFQLNQGRVFGYVRELDMQHGLLNREVLWQSPQGKLLRFVFNRFTSMADPHILVQQVTITALSEIEKLECVVDFDTENALNYAYTTEGAVKVSHWQNTSASHPESYITAWQGETNQSGYKVEMHQFVNVNRPNIIIEAVDDEKRPGNKFSVSLENETSITMTRLVAIATSRDTNNLSDFVSQGLKEAIEKGYDTLKAEHCAAWEKIWDDMDILIEGDEYVQKAARFAAYQLIIAAPQHDERVSIGAKTLSGPGYKGHIFWDTELFMLPPFTLTQPQTARNLLMYRYHNLAGARKKAQEEGFKGAMFPWESTDTGEETTPKWTLPDKEGNRIRIWTGDHEQHISSDIAYAVWQYWQWTGDNAFFQKHGAEIILDTAVFWYSRVEWNEAKQHYELLQQIGPDEYHENIDNSVYTNRMVVWHLAHAFKTLDWLRTHAPEAAQTLQTQLAITDEVTTKWRDIIEKMLIPRSESLNVYEQFNGYFGKEEVNLAMYVPRVTAMDVILGHSRVNASQVIKQADVVMLIALLGTELGDHAELMRNWEVYVPRTSHGSSLSQAIHAWVAARLGLVDEAYEHWIEAAGIDLEDTKGNVRDGIHGAANGGLWQALIFGFAGLQLDDEKGWKVDPKIPSWWKSMTFSFYYRGEKQKVTIKPK